MSCRVDTTERFDQEFRKLDHYTQRMLKAWIEKHLVGCEDPRAKGKGLTANLSCEKGADGAVKCEDVFVKLFLKPPSQREVPEGRRESHKQGARDTRLFFMRG